MVMVMVMVMVMQSVIFSTRLILIIFFRYHLLFVIIFLSSTYSSLSEISVTFVTRY